MKKLIKLILIVVVVMFALVNYRIFSFNKGFCKTQIEGKNISQAISTLTGIKKIEYYEKTIKDDEYTYKVYIVTNQDSYLLDATQEDIDSFSVLGIFSEKLQPEKINPIPFYIEIVICIIILAIPSGNRGKTKIAKSC